MVAVAWMWPEPAVHVTSPAERVLPRMLSENLLPLGFSEIWKPSPVSLFNSCRENSARAAEARQNVRTPAHRPARRSEGRMVSPGLTEWFARRTLLERGVTCLRLTSFRVASAPYPRAG